MSRILIALVDYHKGNIKSVERGLQAQGADVVVSDEPAVIGRADAIVLPGVGAFADAMATLDDVGISSVVKERIDAGVPFLGICLGLHLLFEGGTEHASGDRPTLGLGVLPGIVSEMPRRNVEGEAFKVPHVGWNSIRSVASSPLLDGIPEGEHFYFTHSYIAPECDCAIAYTEHSVAFPSVVCYKNAFGVQFHPEKSSNAGARLLKNFVELASA